MRTRRRAVRVGGVFAVVAAIILAMLGVPTTSAQADLLHPRQDWMRNSVSGLFLHWGMRTSPSFTSCSAWESAVNGGGWSANYWVQEAEKLHASYLVLASFHSRLGYARAWPSSVPGSCTTRTDYLGQLITAAHNRGLKVILYMTDDPKWWNEGLGSGQSWLNSGAYSAWKGRTVDLHTRDGFGEFSMDNWLEVANRYPALDGFWVDNDNAFWERNNLYRRIHDMRPHMVLSNNNEDTPEMDIVSNEQKTGMTPSWDMASAIGSAMPRLTEACYKLPSGGGWWYTGSNTAVDTKLNIGRMISNAGASIKSHMAETAMVNGRFPSNQATFNNFADGYLDQIWGSLGGTEGGGYMHGGFPGGPFGNGAFGATTISKTNPNLHFIHVVDRATGSSINLRDNGYRVSRVTDFRTGANRPFTQANGVLTINGITSWDQYDTVLRVETNGREGIHPVGTVTASATASASGRPASALVDGNYLNYWDNNATLPVTLTLNLGGSKRAQYLGINQREWSPTHPRDDFGGKQDSARIRNYTVQYSTNGGGSWTTIRSATMPSRRGVQFIDLNVAAATHVRLVVNSTWAASDVPNYVRRLRIDEMFVGSAYAGGGPTPPPGRFEAENATIINGAAESEHAGFSGTGYVNTANAVGAGVTWTVDATAGNATLRFRYANGVTTNRPMELSVNGGPPTVVNFPGTGAWTTWADATVTVPLNAGGNSIRLTATTAGGAPNLDRLDVS